MKQILLFVAIFLAVAYAWPTQIGGCGSPIFYDSFNGTANVHSSEYASNGSWILTGVPTTWYPSTQYLITINGVNAGVNLTKNCRVRGFLLAAYDDQLTAYGTWSDTLGYAQTKTCGQDDVVATPNPNFGKPGFEVLAGTVGSHTGLIGTTFKIYQLLTVTWTSPPLAMNLNFSGVIVSDMAYNSLLPRYSTVGIQGTFPIPTQTTAIIQSTATPQSTAIAGSSASPTVTPSTAHTGSASGLAASIVLSGLLLATLL